MLYPKNVPNIERALRVLLGTVLIGIALFGQPVFLEVSSLTIGVLIFSALFVIVTGFIG